MQSIQERLNFERDYITNQRIELEAEKRIFFKENPLSDSESGSDEEDSDVVVLNIGGTLMPVLRETIMSKPGSTLAQIVSGKHQHHYDKDGHIFLDCNPTAFSHILDFLRSDHFSLTFENDEIERLFNHQIKQFDLLPEITPYKLVWNTIHKSPGLTVSSDGKAVTVTGDDGDHLILLGEEPITKGSVSITIKMSIPRPNRYSLGVLLDIPPAFNRGFGYKNGLIGFGLHDHSSSLGIFCQTQKVAESTHGYTSNDLVTMTVDVTKGSLTFQVNGAKCAELANCEMLMGSVWMAATLFNKGSSWKIIS
eukprot:MONOS_278.1-p1 / transcript=MONOS_278.1 / gene=MONOS_278 / organism=Monocercomonoides_exilis_PA203 / gene_product=unspecified product / transcript_product=unspecified product / location=Mono_scaffold00004:280201-281587(+) / protein_length=307 / sequence_SO=supercontig / SO=protein_coding / is_pseudo=false